jgi:hypothetical protein
MIYNEQVAEQQAVCKLFKASLESVGIDITGLW